LDRVIVEELARFREAVAWLPALPNAEKSSGAVKLVGGVLDGPPGKAIAQHLADDFELPLVDFGQFAPRLRHDADPFLRVFCSPGHLLDVGRWSVLSPSRRPRLPPNGTPFAACPFSATLIELRRVSLATWLIVLS